MLLQAIQKHPAEKIALCDEQSSVNYGELKQEIQNRVEALQEVSVLAIALDNGVDWILWDLAALQAGIVCVPLPPFFTQEQIDHAISVAGVTHILSPGGLRPSGISAAANLPAGTAKVTFTSGTTAAPKGVCLPQSAMDNVARSIFDVLGSEFVGTHASVLPLAVLLENVAGVCAGLIAGCTIKFTSLSRFGARYEHIRDVLENTGANSVILVPEILRSLMAQVAARGALPDLRFIAVGGSKIDSALIKQARAMGLPVYEGYGLSECASVVAMNTPGRDRPGATGKLLPHVKARIVDGEIQIKNPGFLGYIGEPVSSMFNTGDLGEFDADGFLKVTGRKKNVLITSYGRNISPEWVEATLLAQPAIAQVIIYGDAKPDLSALVVPSSPQADVADAIEGANAALPDYAQVKEFQISSPFTVENGLLTGTGRPRRDQIMKTLKIKENAHELLRSTG